MVYFLSDAHIGSRALNDREGHQARVVELLDQMAQDAEAVWLLGDIFDFWYEYLWERGRCHKGNHSKAQYAPLLECLKRLTDKGIEVHYFIGNHDIWTFGELAELTGVIVHREPLSQIIGGKRFFMAHGDGLVPEGYMEEVSPVVRKRIRRFMHLRRFFHHPVPQLLYRLMPPKWGDGFGYEWARRSRLKELSHPCPYKGEAREELVRYAKEMEQKGNHHDFYIFGHRHIELDLMITRMSRVMILGDMFRTWTYASYDGENLWLNNMEEESTNQ